MKTFSTLATAGSYATSSTHSVLVGRTVANTQFLKAMVRHSAFEQFQLFIGENADKAELDKWISEFPTTAQARFKICHLLELPGMLSRGEVDVVHHNTPGDKLFDLFWLRNRYAQKTVPVTGQVHSLSYPRMPRDQAMARWLAPQACDAVFCSSHAGRAVVEKMISSLPAAEALPWQLPVVPLGVDLDAVQKGDRAAFRAQASIPDNAFVLLSMARFSEYDKTDLFPLLQVIRTLVKSPTDAQRPVYLVLAGARQGTQTPEMLQLWARVLGFEKRLRLLIDFPDAEKKHILAGSDVFVSPCDNVQETFGQSVVEAMAAGLAVVVSDFDGYKDTVTEGVGIRVPTRLNVDWNELSDIAGILYERPLHLLLGQSVEVDLKALTQSLKRLHDNKAEGEALGLAAQRHAEAQFAWSRVIPKYEAIWKSLAAQPFTQGTEGHHPLRLSFDDAFSHYPTHGPQGARRVQSSPFSRELLVPNAGLKYVLYPELKHLFSLDDVVPLLSLAEKPVTVESLWTHAQALRSKQPGWVAQLLVAWMLKHGLLIDA